MGRVIPFVAALVLCSAGAAVVAQANPFPPGGAATPRPPSLPGQPPRDPSAAPQTGTGRIEGRVLGAPGNAPLRRAQIQLTSSDSSQRHLTSTDGDGRFVFEQVAVGRFSVTATKAGYVTLQYGQRRPYESGTPITLTEGQKLQRVDFVLPKGSVIAVRILDEFGEPVTGVTLQAQRYQYGADGQRRLSPVTGSPTPFSGTDDRGEFRLFGLMPGEYIVQASMRGPGSPAAPADASSEGYSPTFYPGTPSADQAQAVSVGIGEEQTIQFSMTSGRLGRVSGIVVDAAARPVAGAQLSLVTVSGTGAMTSSVGQSAADGRFMITGLTPGDHTLQASVRTPGVRPQFGSAPIAVTGEDLAGVQITLGSGATISGRVVFDGSAPRTGASAPLRVNTVPADGSPRMLNLSAGYDPQANGVLDENGSFAISGVSGRVFIDPVVPPGWIVRSTIVNGENVTDEPIELVNGMVLSDVRIVVTDKVTGVSGQVTDERGRTERDYVVVVLPAAKAEPIVAARFTRLARPDTNGRYALSQLRPGSYVAVALDAIEEGRQYSPEFQEKLRRRARAFTLKEGQAATLDLDLVTGM